MLKSYKGIVHRKENYSKHEDMPNITFHMTITN